MTGRAVIEGINEFDMQFRGIPADFREELRNGMRPIWDEWAEDAGPGAKEILKTLEEYHDAYVKAKSLS